MKTAATITLTSLVLLLSGCAQLRPQDDYWIKPGQAHVSNRAVSLLYYADYLHGLNATDYAQEVEHARLLYGKEKSNFRLLQYALALSAPGGDTRKAQQLMETMRKESRASDPDLAALAQLIDLDLTERRRLEAGARRAESEARRADELEKKLEALKNIEKGLIQRGPRSIGTDEKP